MGLKTTKSVSLNGQSMVNGAQAVFYSANVSTDGSNTTSINQSITDYEVYKANREECRADYEEFQQMVWKIEDELMDEETAKNKLVKK